MASRAAQWQRAGAQRLRLAGDWSLLFDRRAHHRLSSELDRLQGVRDYHWDLRGVDSLDSGGALLLWRLWGRRLPAGLDCRDEHRRWFQRLEASQPPPAPRVPHIERALLRVSAAGAAAGRTLVGLAMLAWQLLLDLGYCARHPRSIPWREGSATLYSAGATSMVLLGIVGAAIGVVATIQIGITLRYFGAEERISGLVSLAMLRELGAIMAAIIVAGRSGSAMTAGLGGMHVTQEFAALRAFGASATQRLVLPRVVGMALALPLLVVWVDFTSLVAAAFMSQTYLGVGWELFLARVPSSVPLVNFWIGVGKGVLFGVVIALVACYFGLATAPDTASLRRNTTASVVTSLSLVMILDAASGVLLLGVGL